MYSMPSGNIHGQVRKSSVSCVCRLEEVSCVSQRLRKVSVSSACSVSCVWCVSPNGSVLSYSGRCEQCGDDATTLRRGTSSRTLCLQPAGRTSHPPSDFLSQVGLSSLTPRRPRVPFNPVS
ncbi:hypothetical protein E2C01_015995 [Portunus trituberculatus]|uniref:Uncharacterized protein n=1 Tax=Portunus trituberculatus TaxID=210409 RepID=A0A5B7DPS8_PORTR|nr:hypothetical protein [Portunus trituberculatus]